MFVLLPLLDGPGACDPYEHNDLPGQDRRQAQRRDAAEGVVPSVCARDEGPVPARETRRSALADRVRGVLFDPGRRGQHCSGNLATADRRLDLGSRAGSDLHGPVYEESGGRGGTNEDPRGAAESRTAAQAGSGDRWRPARRGFQLVVAVVSAGNDCASWIRGVAHVLGGVSGDVKREQDCGRSRLFRSRHRYRCSNVISIRTTVIIVHVFGSL